jgi:hypothetical protein
MDAAAPLDKGETLGKDAQHLDRYGRVVASNVVPDRKTRAELAADAANPTSPTQAQSAAALKLDRPDAPKSPGPVHDTPDGLVRVNPDNSITPLGVKAYHPPQALGGMNALYDQADPKALAAAIMRGEREPDTGNLGRPIGAAVDSELAKAGYNKSSAITDWRATQKHVATMNGAQQLRLTQSVNALPDLLDTVDFLAQKWKGGSFPILNKANLALAKNGVYGSDVASLANQLDTQIADVTADLGNVYMGGNSPTDHALQLAGKSLNSDWDAKVLRDMVALARSNVTIRANSIKNTGVAGASEANPYAPKAEAPAAGIRVTAPNGKAYAFPDQGAADQFVTDAKAKGLWK